MEASGQTAKGGTAPVLSRALYDEALPRVFGYFIHRCGGDAAVAEDLTQETFMAAVRELKARQRHLDSPVGWLLGIARHKLIDHYRAQGRERRRIEALASEPATDEYVEWEGEASRDQAVVALQDVAEVQRTALTLRYMDGMSVPEVAATLGKSIHATESLLARGRSRFKQAYAEVAP